MILRTHGTVARPPRTDAPVTPTIGRYRRRWCRTPLYRTAVTTLSEGVLFVVSVVTATAALEARRHLAPWRFTSAMPSTKRKSADAAYPEALALVEAHAIQMSAASLLVRVSAPMRPEERSKRLRKSIEIAEIVVTPTPSMPASPSPWSSLPLSPKDVEESQLPSPLQRLTRVCTPVLAFRTAAAGAPLAALSVRHI